MVHFKPLVTFMAVAHQLILTDAVSHIGSSDVCGSGTYGELVPIIKSYPIAQAFCSAAYPPACTTTPGRSVRKRSPQSLVEKRLASSSTLAPPLPTPMIIAKAVNAQSSAWSKVRKQPKSVISTICSCIESHKPCTTTTTPEAQATLVPCDPTTSGSGAGGCNSDCFCDGDIDTTHSYCTGFGSSGGSGAVCNIDLQCPIGEFCDIDGYCENSRGCTSTYSPPAKRSLGMRGVGMV